MWVLMVVHFSEFTDNINIIGTGHATVTGMTIAAGLKGKGEGIGRGAPNSLSLPPKKTQSCHPERK